MLKEIVLLSFIALISVEADISTYLPPSRGQSQYNNQHQLHGSNQNNVPFGRRRNSPNSLNQFSEQSSPSSQYGNPVPRGRRPPTGYQEPSSPRRSGNSRAHSSQSGKSGVQYSHHPSTQGQYGVPGTSTEYVSSRGKILQNQRGLPHNTNHQYGTPGDNTYSTSNNVGGSQRNRPKYGSSSSTYGTPEGPRSNRFGGGLDSSRFGGSRGQNLPRTPSAIYDVPPPTYGPSSSEMMTQDDELDDMNSENYDFMYQVQDAESGNDFGHMESRKDGYTQGSYYVMLPNGRKQIVEYKVTEDGYKPMVRYEETANSDMYSLASNQGGRY